MLSSNQSDSRQSCDTSNIKKGRHYHGMNRAEDDVCFITRKHDDNHKRMKYYTRNFHCFPNENLRVVDAVGFYYEDGPGLPMDNIGADSYLRMGQGTKLTNLNFPQQLNQFPVRNGFVKGCLNADKESDLTRGLFQHGSKSCLPVSEMRFSNHIDIFDHLNYNPNDHRNVVIDNYTTWGGESTRNNLRQSHRDGKNCFKQLNPLFPLRYAGNQCNGNNHKNCNCVIKK